MITLRLNNNCNLRDGPLFSRRGAMKIFFLQTFFYAPLQTMFLNNTFLHTIYFPISFSHVLTQKGGSIFAAVNHHLI